MFEFATAARIIFGPGKAREAGRLAEGLGNCALVVTGQNTSRAEPVLAALRQSDIGISMFCVTGEPDLGAVERGTAQAKQEDCDLVLSIGGGRRLDVGNTLPAVRPNSGGLAQYPTIYPRPTLLSK